MGSTTRSGFGWKAAESGKVFKSSERVHGARKKSAKGSRERRGEEGRGAVGVLHQSSNNYGRRNVGGDSSLSALADFIAQNDVSNSYIRRFLYDQKKTTPSVRGIP